MTHPTYTHPGANAALLALSRARNREARLIKQIADWSTYGEHLLTGSLRRAAERAKRAQYKALYELMKINYRNDPVQIPWGECKEHHAVWIGEKKHCES
jgi:hypothetical protein